MSTTRTNRLGAIARTLFTSFVAPLLVSFVISATKTDDRSWAHRESSSPSQSALISPQLAPPVAAALAPPMTVNSPSSAPLGPDPMPQSRQLVWQPAN
jgi:hypothetical protein